MADINIKPDISLGARAPDSMTSLGNMLNIARGAQAYQQEQKLNPLAVQAAQLEVEKQQGMLQPSIRQAEAQAGTAEFNLQQKHFDLAGNLITGFESSPAFKSGDVKGMKTQLDVMQNIAEANGLPVSKTFEPLHKMLDEGNIEGVKNTMQNLRNGMASTESKFSAGLPSLTSVGGQPATFAPGGQQQAAISPAQIGATAPAQNAPNQGMGAQPVAAPQAIQEQQLAQSVIPEAQSISQPIAPRFQPKPGNMVTDPSEIAYRDQGIKYIQSLASQQLDLTTQKRNVQEATQSISKLIGPDWQTYGIGGKIKKEFSEKIAGNPEYAKVSKDIANLELSNLRNAGGNVNSVEGLKLQQRASGSETYPPEVLTGIVRRINSEYTNTELQAKAAQNYAKKFGESNLPTSFMEMWANNADSKVFELMNVVKEVKNLQKREEVLTDLFGNDPKTLGVAWQKYKNIQKLVKDGTL